MPIFEKENDNAGWLKEAIVYQVYVRSFKDGNNDGIGDLYGLIEKLDYLNDGTSKSLGVNTIWLNPIYTSPMRDFGYDISNYYDIDPLYGGMETFERLVEEVHKRGMRIIMDFVPNHTSIEHPWFVESRASRDNPKRDWYIWKDASPDGSPPNNWLSKLGGSAWTLDETTGQYYLHKYLVEQPDLNWRNKEVREEMKRVLRFWLDKGVDGFRTDAINQLIEDEYFADDPVNPNYTPGKDDPYEALLHIHSRNHPDTFEIMGVFCEVLAEREGRYMITEAHVGLDDLPKFYHACTAGVIVPFNFNLIGLPWDARTYKMFVDDFERSLHTKHWPNYVLGNHDLPRVMTRLGSARTRIATMLVLTLRGTPFIYYGDEIGLENVYIPEGDIQDPWATDAPGLGMGRDASRTPMQWDAGAHAGFTDTSVRPWLPVDAGYRSRNVAEEEKESASMLHLYKELIQIRKSSPALQIGAYHALPALTQEVYAYERVHGSEEVIVALNFGKVNRKVVVPHGKWKVLLSTTVRDKGSVIENGEIVLGPFEGVIVRKEGSA